MPVTALPANSEIYGIRWDSGANDGFDAALRSSTAPFSDTRIVSMTAQRPIQPIPLLPEGDPEHGLQPCQLIPDENILTGHGHKELIHNAFQTDGGAFTVGVWESTPCKDRCVYDVDEACFIIKGKVVVTEETSGEAWTFGPGDVFVIPKGFTGTWETVETVRKFHFIYDGNSGADLLTS
jgi:uncharacterized cupin superfamily protein